MGMVPQVLNIAHRGARSLAPENTLAAARKALAIGADLWELDVNRSADGELVILHDDTLERTSNVLEVFPDRQPWRVSDFSLAELRRLDFGSWYEQQDPFQQIARGNVSRAELDSFRGEPISTLREALTFTRDHHWRVNVEIKDLTGTPGDAVVVQEVVGLIDSLGMADHVLLSSFNHVYLERARGIDPLIARAALIETAVEDPESLLARLEVEALNPDYDLTTPDMIRELRAAGYDVYVWTVNDLSKMRGLIEAGVSGIITDFPQLLVQALA